MSKTRSNAPERRRKRRPSPPAPEIGPSKLKWVLFGLVLFLFIRPWLPFGNTAPQKPRDITQLEFRGLVASNRVEKVERVRLTDTNATYLEGTEAGSSAARFRVTLVPGENESLMAFLDEHGVACAVKEREPAFGPFLQQLLFLLPMILIFWFFFLRRPGGSGGPFGMGKSKARLLNEDKSKKRVTFADVAGVDEAKEEVQEIVAFLKDPAKFTRLGGRIPKGVLLVGPPGTGKTLLAKAIAGEAEVPFFSISGSDFEEMFVGVGASRVRDMFDQGKKNAPCLIFIDEIDSVGQRRNGPASGTGHYSNEQTLNAMLVEMDGFDANEGVIIIAATNRPDVLDPALLRPGRFDRQIYVDLPTLKGREEILDLHGKRIRFAEDADLKRIARGTPGFSGADLANLLNEAALLAVRRNLDAVTHAVLEEARDKVLWGRERRSAGYTQKARETTAWHEAGHAILQLLLPNADPLHKVTIIPRGRALGATMALPDHDVLNRSRGWFLDEIALCCGGRIAEEMHTGEITTGAAQDIAQATKTARDMVCRYGMSDAFGFQAFRQPNPFAADDTPPALAEKTAEAIDAEVAKIIADAFERARALLEANRDKLELLAKTLFEKESMDGRDVEALLGIEPKHKAEDEEETKPAEDAPVEEESGQEKPAE